MVPRADFAS